MPEGPGGSVRDLSNMTRFDEGSVTLRSPQGRRMTTRELVGVNDGEDVACGGVDLRPVCYVGRVLEGRVGRGVGPELAGGAVVVRAGEQQRLAAAPKLQEELDPAGHRR